MAKWVVLIFVLSFDWCSILEKISKRHQVDRTSSNFSLNTVHYPLIPTASSLTPNYESVYTNPHCSCRWHGVWDYLTYYISAGDRAIGSIFTSTNRGGIFADHSICGGAVDLLFVDSGFKPDSGHGASR